MTISKYSRFFFFLLFSGLLILAGCGDDDTTVEPKGAYETGIFITNEGPFQTGSGTITFFNTADNTTEQAIFESVNGRPLGNIVQSITVIGDMAYIIVNNASKIEVVNANTFESVATIEGFTMPRYLMGITETKAYVSQWGESGINGAIQVLDLTNNTITKTIAVGMGTDRMLKDGDNVYVVNAGGFGTDSTVSVLNTSTDEVEKTITTDTKPNSLQMVDNQIFALCGGTQDWYNSINNTAGSLWNISTEEVAYTFPTTDDHPNDLTKDSQGNLYCSNAGQVIRLMENNGTYSTTAFIPKSFYRFTYNSVDGYFYGSDALDFASNGFVFRYQTDGAMVDSIQAGIIPGGFGFR